MPNEQFTKINIYPVHTDEGKRYFWEAYKEKKGPLCLIFPAMGGTKAQLERSSRMIVRTLYCCPDEITARVERIILNTGLLEQAVAEILKKFTAVRILDCDKHPFITDGTFSKIVTAFQKLEALNLTGCHFIDSRVIETILGTTPVLKEVKLPSGEFLILNNGLNNNEQQLSPQDGDNEATLALQSVMGEERPVTIEEYGEESELRKLLNPITLTPPSSPPTTRKREGQEYGLSPRTRQRLEAIRPADFYATTPPQKDWSSSLSEQGMRKNSIYLG